MRVLLAGEGPDDLGEWAKEAPYRNTIDPEIGVIEALLRRVATTPFTIVSARLWKKIQKYKSGDHLQPETRTVLGLALDAQEADCDVVVFVRDRDGDEERHVDVETGIQKAREKFSIPIAGGMAIEEIEAWILALKGERRSERHRNAKSVLYQKHSIRGRAAMVAVIENTDLNLIADDASSFRQWTKNASNIFLRTS